MNQTAVERARRIRLLLFDVDGVLTDGGIWIVPSASSRPSEAMTAPQRGRDDGDGGGFAISSSTMVETKGFSAHDGAGISLAKLGGIPCGIITRRVSESVALRARDLRFEYVYMGQQYKIQALREIMEKGGFAAEEIAYVGDDVIDLPVMRVCGLAIAVANARPQVKAAAHFVTPHEGGYGAGRDAIEFILNAKGVLDQCIERYIDEHQTISASEDTGKGGGF